MKKMKILSILFAVILVSGLFTACSGSSSSTAGSADMNYAAQTTAASTRSKASVADYSGVSPAAPAQGEATTDSESGGGFVPETERKIIRNANLSIETTDFDKSVATLRALVEKYAGYIQNSSESGVSAVSQKTQSRRASYSLRLPADKLDTFLSGAGEIGNVLSTSTSSDEITDQYYDSEAHLKSLQVQEERLLAILNKATELKDVIELEKALSDTRYQIESITSTLRRYDSLVAYSTVGVELREVADLQTVAPLPKTLSERIAQRFSQTMKTIKEGSAAFVVWFVGDLPLIVINLAIIALILYVFILVLRRLGIIKKRKKDLPPPETKPENKDKK